MAKTAIALMHGAFLLLLIAAVTLWLRGDPHGSAVPTMLGFSTAVLSFGNLAISKLRQRIAELEAQGV